MVVTWDSVAANPQYLALPPDQQENARKQYFDTIVAPNVPKEHLDAARSQFEAHASKSTESESFPDVLGRRFSEALASRPSVPSAPKNTHEFMEQMKGIIPGTMKALGAGIGMAASPLGAAGETLEYKGAKAAGATDSAARSVAKNTGDVSEALIGLVPGIKDAPEAIGELTTSAAGKALALPRKVVNAISDKLGSPNVSAVDKANAHIIKTLLKAGHSPEEIVEMIGNAKNLGQTAGEASKNPKLLGEERKISGMSSPGGKTVREFARERVNPKNPASIPSKLKAAASPMFKKMQSASKDIGETVASAPKYPVDMKSVREALKAEKIVPGSTISTTVKKINDLSNWARKERDTFAAWHRVKQEIYNLKSAASNPNSIEKLDSNTVNAYYKMVNEILRGEKPGLPEGLSATGKKYAVANDTYRENKAGEMIHDVLKDMPTGGSPNAALNYLYKNLAGSPAAQEELFGHMPAPQRAGIMKILKAINDSARGGVSDIVKSGEEGTPTFPTSMSQTIARMKDWLVDRIRHKDYDALAKVLTNPDAKEIAKYLGVKTPSAPTSTATANQAIGAAP